jgi:type IV secretory pathway VirB4 component
LTFADIAGVAAIGLVVAIVYFQSRQRKFTGLIEIFKLLNGKEQREARAMLFEAYRKYEETGDDSIFDTEFYREYVNRTLSDFNEVGALVRKGLVSTSLFLDVYWNITLRSWNASKVIIYKRRTSRNYDDYMINFEMLARDAERYRKRYSPNSSVEPF